MLQNATSVAKATPIARCTIRRISAPAPTTAPTTAAILPANTSACAQAASSPLRHTSGSTTKLPIAHVSTQTTNPRPAPIIATRPQSYLPNIRRSLVSTTACAISYFPLLVTVIIKHPCVLCKNSILLMVLNRGLPVTLQIPQPTYPRNQYPYHYIKRSMHQCQHPTDTHHYH